MAVDGRGALVGQRLGGYQLVSLLGVGGMAEVYLARELRLRREVAVKVLPATLAADPEYVKRFKNEATQVAALNHPHIVPVYYFDSDRGLLYLVMPVLRESLRERLDRERVLPATDAVELTIQIASGLRAAHRLGLVHRDVKPENILLNAAGKALLSDFGIARQVTFARQDGVAQTLAATGLPVGTPEYMAPEQLRGSNVDQRADIYALGAVLYELLTGVVPHDAASPYEVAALVLTEQIIPPAQRNPMIGPALEAVVLRSLAKDPHERYQDAEQFATALGQAMKDEASQYRTGRRGLIGGPRTTRRFTHPSLFPPVGGGGLPDVPTDLTMSAVTTRPRTAMPRATGGGTGEGTGAPRYRGAAGAGSRWLALGAAMMLLVATACGFGAVRFFGSPQLPSGPTGDGRTPTAILTPTPKSTHFVGGGGFPTQPAITATIGVIGQSSPTPFGTPTVSPSPTATARPSPTAKASPPLAFYPDTFTFTSTKRGGCATTQQQAIVNTSNQIITWQWQPPTHSGFSFKVVGSSGSVTMSWPSDTTGIAPGGSDFLTVANATSTACGSLPITVTVQDSQGNSYTVKMTK